QPEPGKQPNHSLGTPSGCPTDWVHLTIDQLSNSGQASYNLIEQSGNQLKIKDPAKLPSICVGCGSESDLVKVKERLRYVNPVVMLWILLSPLALIIAYSVFRKDVNIEFERCSSCHNKKVIWSKISMISWLSFVGSIILRFQFDGVVGVFFGVMIFAFFLFSLFASAMKDPGVSVKKYSEPYFYLKGLKKSVASKIVNG
ncbi:hypothetical protein, partial [Marinobacter xestospongiae]